MIPIGPDFQDPVGAPNYPPVLHELTPRFGTNVDVTLDMTQQFDVIATDLNSGDTLYVLWALDFPPYVPGTTQLIGDGMLGAPAGSQQSRTISQVVTCVGVSLNGPTQHRLKLIVGDRQLNLADLQSGVVDTIAPGGLVATADWPVNFSCLPSGLQ